MDRLSYSTFNVARFFMAICVFFCHVFESFNDFGFLFVGVFFFMSGYGMEKSGRKGSSLTRLVPYLLYFAWFSLIYFMFFRVFIYPSSWFLVCYFCVMVIYRFVSNIYALLWSYIGFAAFLILSGFNWVWSASFGAFLFGVFFARNPSAFTLRNCLYLVPIVVLLPWAGSPALWVLLPLFSWLVLSFSSIRIFRPIAFLGGYSFYFYCVHCLVLGLFGATWTLGGSPSFMACLGAFCVSVVVSVFFKDYLFNYPKIQKAG